MIWDQPIHQNRTIKSWLSDKETGFSSQVIELISKVEGKLTPGPAELARKNKIIVFQDFSEILKLCKFMQACATTADYALWADTRGLSQRMRSKNECEWLECSWRNAYIIADILVISDIPHKDDPDLHARADRREAEMLVDARQKRGGNITLIIGPNTDLESIRKYKAIHDALKEVDSGD